MQTYSRDMYRAARALTPCDADAQDAVGQAVLLAWQSLDRLRDPEA
ncbi:MAG TPA: RNA polymerase subunit sigma-70, partial [Oscillibacter sp.]|nr:RNA polymerase subunit sigma-70 [Oscillibacter sp.]